MLFWCHSSYSCFGRVPCSQEEKWWNEEVLPWCAQEEVVACSRSAPNIKPICRNVCVFKFICVYYAHLHFWSIIFVICCVLYCNLHHLFVFINRIVCSKPWINNSPHIFVPFELSVYLINIKGTYMQPMFSLSLIGKSFMCYLSLSLSLIVPHIQLFLPLWSYVVNY